VRGGEEKRGLPARETEDEFADSLRKKEPGAEGNQEGKKRPPITEGRKPSRKSSRSRGERGKKSFFLLSIRERKGTLRPGKRE